MESVGKESRKEPGVSALDSLRNFKNRASEPSSHFAKFAKSWHNEHWFNLVLSGKECILCLVEYDPAS